MRIPKRLKKDAIIEALCEIRFEREDLAEIVIGRLASQDVWANARQSRLPIANIPDAIREIDPALRFQATIELRQAASNRVGKIGSNVYSYHMLNPYAGWQVFSTELKTQVDRLFLSVTGFRAVRLGFRYLNFLNLDDHHITDINSLLHEVRICDKPLLPPYNLNYLRQYGDDHKAMVKISSPELIQNAPQVPFTAMIDIDISTPDGFSCSDKDAMIAWIEKAHLLEKQEFFSLIPQKIQEEITDVWE